MADNLDKDFDQEEDLSAAFDQESDLGGEFNVKPMEEKAGKLEAFIGGGLQDLSLGFMDEIKGGIEAAGQAAGIKGLSQLSPELQSPLGIDTEKLGKAYRGGRDVERQRIAKLEKDQPGAFQAGELTGMIAPIAATGGIGALKGLLTSGTKQIAKQFAKKGAGEVAKGATKEATKQQLKTLAKSGAKVGGAAAAGFSETEALEDPAQLAQETALGAGFGAGTALAIPGATRLGSKAIKKIGRGMREGAKQVTATLAGLKKGTVEDIIERADDIKNAVDYPEIQEIILDKTRNVLGNIEKLARAAEDVLPGDKAVAKEAIKQRITDRVAKINKTADDSAVPHLNKINEFIDDQTKFEGELISLKDLHKIVQDTGKRAYRGVSKDAPGAVKKQLRETYHELSEILKEMAPGKNYSKLSDEMSNRYDVLDRLEKKLGIKIDYDDVMVKSEDQLIKKLSEVGQVDATGKKRTDIEKLLDELEVLRGKKMDEKSLGDLLKARRLQGELDKGASEYSYVGRTLGGGAAGMLLGGPAGAQIGTVAGLAARPLTRKLLRRSGGLGKSNLSEKAAKATNRAAEFGGSLGLSKGISSGSKIAVDDNRTATKLNDPQYLDKLIADFKESELPGASTYADQLDRYRSTENPQEKVQIQFNLSQQPSFRELLRQYDKIEDKKKTKAGE